MEDHLKKLTLLHSNDMHGDFLEEAPDDKLVGGVSMLSGYISKVRREEENVLYVIAGDMFRGSVIDTEFQGISTIRIMNMLSPDIATIGNHETDYGVGHLLFLEKCADFPIVNANMYLKTNHTRLFEPCRVIETGGMKILFIGVLTESTLSQRELGGLIGDYVSIEDAASAVERVCNVYKGTDIDLTVLLTHIGFDEDRKLAEKLSPLLGVDLIIGGHSHTVMDEPFVVNGIPIVQAGTGTDQIGRFDILVDTDTNSVHSFTWETVPVDESHCPRDMAIEEMISSFKSHTDEKYGRIITRFRRVLSHPEANGETELGNLFSDILKDTLGVDIFLCASGSIRRKEMGPVVTFGDLLECFPFDDEAHMVHMTGEQLKHAVRYMLREEALTEDIHNEFYQFSRGLEVVYDRSSGEFSRFSFEGEPVDDLREYTVGLQDYHFRNMETSFDLTIEEVCKKHRERMLSTSCRQIVEEVLSEGRMQDSGIYGRLVLRG